MLLLPSQWLLLLLLLLLLHAPCFSHHFTIITVCCPGNGWFTETFYQPEMDHQHGQKQFTNGSRKRIIDENGSSMKMVHQHKWFTKLFIDGNGLSTGIDGNGLLTGNGL